MDKLKLISDVKLAKTFDEILKALEALNECESEEVDRWQLDLEQFDDIAFALNNDYELPENVQDCKNFIGDVLKVVVDQMATRFYQQKMQ